MARLTAAAACVLVVCGAGCAGQPPPGDGHRGHTPRDRTVLIVLSMKAVGGQLQCDYDIADARAYSKDKVTFQVVNRCTDAQTVTIEFEKKPPPGSTYTSPFDDPEPYTVSEVRPGGKGQVKLTVRDHGNLTDSVPYQYDAAINGRKGRDPKLEIDPY